MTFLSVSIRRTSDAVAASARRVEGLLDGALPVSGPARASVIVFLAMAFYVAFEAWAMRATGGPVDFAVYYMAAVSFLEGGSPYGVRDFDALAQALGIERFAVPYFYPPLTAVLVAPLTLLPFRAAAWVWSMANAAAVVAGTALLLGQGRWKSEGLLAWLATVLFVPTLTTLYAGQVAGLLYLTVAFAIRAHERKQLLRAGAALACGALLKITPLVLIGYLLWRGDWRAVTGALLGATALVIATLPVVGVEGWVQFVTLGLGTFHAPDAVAYPPNFTLNGLFLWSFSASSLTVPLVVAPGLVLPFWIASALAVVLLTVAACWPPLQNGRPVRFEMAFILLALQLIPHFTFYHQLVLSLLPAFIVVLVAWRSGACDSRWLAGVVLVVALVDAFGLAWHSLAGNVLLLSVPFLATVALWAALGARIARERRATEGRASSP